MIQIMECTDCQHCISFAQGFRVACGHPDFGADQVYFYEPVGDDSADNCEGFSEGMVLAEFPMDAIDKAVEKFGDDVSSLRKWAIENGRIEGVAK